MNKYEIRAMIVAVLLMGTFLFSLLYNAFSRKIDVPTCTPFNVSFEKPQLKKIDDKTYELYVVAQMWNFLPTDVSIPKGSTVDIFLTSKDVVHGFDIERKGTNLMAVPGAVNKTTVHFSQAGKYRVVCHEYCGVGHQNMMGEINVTE